MSEHVYGPGPDEASVRDLQGNILRVPAGWELVPPGDAALTRRIKAAGEYWMVQEKRGRKIFSRGLWAPAKTVNSIRQELMEERSTESFAKKRQADVARRQKSHEEYVAEFEQTVLDFLAFDSKYKNIAARLARAVTEHATPVGSGTVARTKRIPVEQRAEAAVIAWMRHQTTAYDSMKIARVKGERREVRRQLARRSHELLENYRRGDALPIKCPLMAAIAKIGSENQST
jgi:hypothetical protein